MRFVMAGLAMVVALVAAPAAVGAVSLFGYRNTGVIEIQETSPAADKMTVTARFPDGLYFTDSAGISGTDAPCSQVDAQTALCTVPGTTGLNFNLERKNDRVAVDLPSDPALELFRYKYALGDGNDRFSGGIYPEEVSSGVGKDRLFGGAGNDSLSGGKDADRLDGGDGEDACNGGPDKDQATSCESVKGIP